MTRLNKVLIQGRFGGEPEIKHLDNERRVAYFSVAVDTGYKDDNGQWQERTDWVRVSTFRDRLIEKLEKVRKLKGSSVIVDGRLRSRSYEKDGETRYTVDVEVGAYGDIVVVG